MDAVEDDDAKDCGYESAYFWEESKTTPFWTTAQRLLSPRSPGRTP